MSDSTITIPTEAIEAAAKHLPYSQLFEVHAACLAMLKAWPKTLWDYKREDGTRLILPLPQKEPEA